MFRILIVEDDPDIQEVLQTYLEEEGYEAIPAVDGEEALERFRAGPVDLVLLDLLLPRMDGYHVCAAIREVSDVPVIMLTALDSEAHQLKGFDLRIDDYITKPFSMPVLLRKVGGACVELTRREFELLRVLLQNKGRVLSRQTLLNRVWSYDFYGDERIVDTHVKNLRKKLGGNYIETIRSVGYRVDKEVETKPDR